ncbi:MAG TPA: hypothetical protein VMW87_04625 [Spirochaetia bacterium]|nr:hypothetical protein [Spirochaetia bacterium]
MKRFLRSIIAAAILFHAVSLPLIAESVWYRSDALALPLERISAAAAAGTDYALQVDRDPNGETRQLHHAGSIIERIVQTHDRQGRVDHETVYKQGLLSRESSYAVSGLPDSEIQYSDGKPRVEIFYTYDERNRPKSARTYHFASPENGDSPVRDPTPAWTDSYLYFPGGRSGADSAGTFSISSGPPVTGGSSAGALAEVRRLYSDGVRQISRYDYAGTRLSEEWVGTQSDGVLSRYNNLGLRTVRETWAKNAPVNRETFTYTTAPVDAGTSPAGASSSIPDVLLSSNLENLADGTTTASTYREGRVVRRVESTGGNVISSTEYEYRGENIVQKIAQQGGSTERWTYEYAADNGKPAQESYFLNGKLVEVVHYAEDNRSVRDRYRNGELVLKTYYNGERRVREELIRDGRVTRTLEF